MKYMHIIEDVDSLVLLASFSFKKKISDFYAASKYKETQFFLKSSFSLLKVSIQ